MDKHGDTDSQQRPGDHVTQKMGGGDDPGRSEEHGEDHQREAETGLYERDCDEQGEPGGCVGGGKRVAPGSNPAEAEPVQVRTQEQSGTVSAEHNLQRMDQDQRRQGRHRHKQQRPLTGKGTTADVDTEYVEHEQHQSQPQCERHTEAHAQKVACGANRGAGAGEEPNKGSVHEHDQQYGNNRQAGGADQPAQELGAGGRRAGSGWHVQE